VIAVTVPEGLDKPYFDRQGVIWLKAGADKRRVQSKEELRRLFQDVDLLQADQVPTSAGVNDLDQRKGQALLAEAVHLLHRWRIEAASLGLGEVRAGGNRSAAGPGGG